MQENDALMKREKKGEMHIEDLFQQIEDCVKNVASQNTYTPEQTVPIGFNTIDKCSVYSEYC